jgi:hypothetical protein
VAKYLYLVYLILILGNYRFKFKFFKEVATENGRFASLPRHVHHKLIIFCVSVSSGAATGAGREAACPATIQAASVHPRWARL